MLKSNINAFRSSGPSTNIGLFIKPQCSAWYFSNDLNHNNRSVKKLLFAGSLSIDCCHKITWFLSHHHEIVIKNPLFDERAFLVMNFVPKWGFWTFYLTSWSYFVMNHFVQKLSLLWIKALFRPSEMRTHYDGNERVQTAFKANFWDFVFWFYAYHFQGYVAD